MKLEGLRACRLCVYYTGLQISHILATTGYTLLCKQDVTSVSDYPSSLVHPEIRILTYSPPITRRRSSGGLYSWSDETGEDNKMNELLEVNMVVET